MKRFLPLCMFGLVCLMALAMFAPTAANALTPLTVDQPATLAIQTTPATNIVDDFDTAPLILLSASTATLPGARTDDPVAWRSMPLKISVTVAMNTNLANDSTAITNNSEAANLAPTKDQNALACYPNPFNDETKLVTTPNPAETTPMAASAWATDGGQPQCRAVIALASPVGIFAPRKMAA
ncbi:MAG: hypothetical protein AAB880_00090 [Patescibacteria group bacterium]